MAGPKQRLKIIVWIFGGIVALSVIGSLASDGTTEQVTATPPAAPTRPVGPPPPPPPPPPNPNRCLTINFVDEFGDVTGRGAISAEVEALRPLEFPYHDVMAQIMVDCDRAWIRFSDQPNLTGGDIRDGYEVFSLAVRVDGNDVGRWRVTQDWGSDDVHFSNDAAAISSFASASTVAIALPWYGGRSAAFEWEMDDSSDRIRESCE
ncbi:MAG: hypothetical protein F4Z72_04320 [Gemmatimonadales bacterium]|nr:hypothetical protein [Candidatus Palauibacter irciniicola]